MVQNIVQWVVLETKKGHSMDSGSCIQLPDRKLTQNNLEAGTIQACDETWELVWVRMAPSDTGVTT